MEWGQWAYLLLAIAAGWFLYRYVKNTPDAFSKVNLSKSFYTMGLLSIGLIIFIGLLVLMVRS